MSNNHDEVTFDDVLGDEEWGLILDKDGNLKGLWIPQELSEEDVPDVVVKLIKENWGVDPNDETVYGTIH
jgi:hypothetical protein